MIGPELPTSSIVDAWLYAALSTDPVVAELVGTMLFPGIAPEDPQGVAAIGTAGPDAFVTWQLTVPLPDVRPLVGGPDAGAILLVQGDYTIKAVAAGPPEVAAGIAAAVNAALSGRVEAPPGHPTLALACSRRQPIHYPDTTDRRLWWHSGGTYRLELS